MNIKVAFKKWNGQLTNYIKNPDETGDESYESEDLSDSNDGDDDAADA